MNRKNMNDARFVSLKTNMLVNIIKLVVSLCLILGLAKLYYELESVLVKNIIFVAGIVIVAWFHRINYEENVSLEKDTLNVSIKRTFFGYSFVTVKSLKRGTTSSYSVFAKTSERDDPDIGIKVFLDFSNGTAPICYISKLIKVRGNPF